MGVSDAWWSAHDGYVAQVMAALAAAAERTAVHWRGRAIAAAELVDSVARAAHALRARGIGRGAMVCVLVAPNSPDMLTVRYAAHLLGAGVCYLRSTNAGSTAPVLSADEQLRVLLDTDAVALYTDQENSGRAAVLAERARGRVAVIESNKSIENKESNESNGPAASWDPAMLAVVGLTSGSTGRAKGIQLSGRAWQSRFAATKLAVTEGDQATLLVATPLSHTIGPVADAVLACGGTVVLHEDLDPERALKAVAEHGITRMFVATPHLYELLDQNRVTQADLSSLQRLIYGGCPASPARIAAAAQAFGPILVQGYGTNESGSIAFLSPDDHRDPDRVSTVGRPFPDVTLRVCRAGSEEEVAPGQTGEVCVKSPHLMDGYLGDPARTARVLHGGWYRTGDLGHLDEHGYLHLLDRIADVIKANGIKIYPAIVEGEILALPGVAQAAVYGVRDADSVEHVHAAVVPRHGAEVTADEVRNHVSRALSALQVPEEVRFPGTMPLSHTGKPDRSRLRREASTLAVATYER